MKKRKITYTIADSFQMLCQMQEQALSAEPKPDFATALKIEELKGKLAGFYVETKTGPTPDIPQILVEFTNDNQKSTNTGGIQTADETTKTN